MSVQPMSWPEPAPEVAAAVRAAYRRREPPLPVVVRDRLGELFPDAEFAPAFGVRGRPGWSPGRLALVTVLQMVENLTDRQAADAVRDKISWKYALGLDLDDEGFDASVLSEFRTRVVEHGLEQRVLDLLLAALKAEGLVGAGGKQRTDSTHVIGAVRDLNRLELAGESVRAALEAIAVAAPDWLPTVIELPDWGRRYGARVGTWRLPASKAKRAELATAYGTNAVALLRAVYTAGTAPHWLAELPAVEVLRRVLVQNYVLTTDARGREVIRMREADGLPPGRTRMSSPYDLDARWAANGDDLYWNGYKIHVTETCEDPIAEGDHPDGDQDGERPNLITGGAAQASRSSSSAPRAPTPDTARSWTSRTSWGTGCAPEASRPWSSARTASSTRPPRQASSLRHPPRPRCRPGATARSPCELHDLERADHGGVDRCRDHSDHRARDLQPHSRVAGEDLRVRDQRDGDLRGAVNLAFKHFSKTDEPVAAEH